MTARPSTGRIVQRNSVTWLAAAPSVLVVAGAIWALDDYRRWRALGVGGLPPTWRGWLRMTRLRMRMKDPLDPAPLRARQGSPEDVAALRGLPERAGKRPRVAPHPVPHRQLTDHAPQALRAELKTLFDARVAADPVRLTYALSHFEKNHEAVTLRDHLCCHADARATHGEIAHIHPSDGSMHMVLSASDAGLVVERGWGERHGLAGVMLGLPLTYTLIYAPRDGSEVEIDGMILDAAVAYMANASAGMA